MRVLKDNLFGGSAIAGALAAAVILDAPAHAQTVAPAAPGSAKDAAAKPAKPQPPPEAEEDEETTVSELVVTAARERPQPGAVVGDIKPELQLSPADIRSYGVSSVSDLLNELAPEIQSDRGRGGGPPVVLLNGRRISGFNEIRDIPTEAIVRVDILPEEVALKYGYAADQKVVNIVLRRRFQATTAEAGGGGSTAGGQATGTAELDLLQIRGDNRLNVDLKASASSAITEDERDVTPQTGGLPFDIRGNVTGVAGGQIDPALSALVGKPVTVAGLPVAADTRTLSLSDFVATAGLANVSDVGRYRTLTAETRSASANVVATRALGRAFTGTLNATLDASQSDSLRGLPGVSLVVPAGGPFSPFGQPTVLDRYATNFGPLSQNSTSWTGHLGGGVNRDLSSWRMSFTGAYDHTTSLTRSDVGVDASALQSAVAAGGANPFAPWPDSLLSERGRNKAQSDSNAVQFHALVSGPVLKVPAGPVYASFRASEAKSWLSSDTLRAGVVQSADLSRNTLSGQVSVDVPIAKKSAHVLGLLGDLSVNGNAAVNDLSDFGTLTTLGGGVTWKPVTGLSFIVSTTHDEAAPSMAQLGGPTVVTEAARIFDYATGRTVDVRRLDGGNPALIGDDRRVTKVGVNWKPIASQQLTFSANYIKSRIDNATETFPAATAEIEAAFPDRFLRNAAGQLVQVDYRPVNFAREYREELRWGFNYSRPFGPQPPPRRFGQGGRPGGGQRDGGDAQAAPPRPQPPPESTGTNDNPTAQPAAPGLGDTVGPDTTGTRGGDRGGGRGGGGGGFRGGGPGGAGGGGRLQFALYHTIVFNDEILVRPGVPVFDLLNGSAAGNGGGQPRNAVQAQAGVTRNGLGARLSASWQEATVVNGVAGSPTGDLRFGDLTKVDLRLFANLGANRDLVGKYPFLRGSRLTFAVTNLFDAHQDVRDATGATPAGYQAGYLDPVGRAVRISFRKLFF